MEANRKPKSQGAVSQSASPLDFMPRPQEAKQLIQELDAPETSKGEGPSGCVTTPEHTLEVMAGEGGGGTGGRKEVKVKVTLPGVRSVKEVELEVSEVCLFVWPYNVTYIPTSLICTNIQSSYLPPSLPPPPPA